MLVSINIPKEFEADWERDRFADALGRLRQDAHMLAGNYERETASMLIKAFKEAKTVNNHGIWTCKSIFDNNAGQHWNIWNCNKCGYEAGRGWEATKNGKAPKFRFCPNCGMPMVTGEIGIPTTDTRQAIIGNAPTGQTP